MKTNRNTITEPQLIVNSAHGQYIPKIFLETICAEIKSQIPATDRIILRNPDHEDYWEAWADTLDRNYKLGTQKVRFEHIENLWLVPACFARSKAYKEFNPEF